MELSGGFCNQRLPGNEASNFSQLCAVVLNCFNRYKVFKRVKQHHYNELTGVLYLNSFSLFYLFISTFTEVTFKLNEISKMPFIKLDIR